MTAQSRRDFEAAQYTLRATFYYRSHYIWQSLQELLAHQNHEVSWPEGTELGISERALEQLSDLNVPLWRVFAHPEVLRAEPRLTRYYRCLALLPQKGLGRLAFGTAALEARGGRLSAERARRLAGVLNNLISSLVESDPEWSLERAETAALLNLGSQINGSWRNEIGEEGNRQAKTLLTAALLDDEVVVSITLLDGSQPELPIDSEVAIRVREIVTTNGFRVRFASEPDVAVRDARGVLVGTIEVKYGSDSAGALERYGAVRKSFEAAARENARVQNVYLANVITEEVRKRIDEDRLVAATFEFSEIFLSQQERERFLRFFKRRLLDL